MLLIKDVPGTNWLTEFVFAPVTGTSSFILYTLSILEYL